MKKINVIPLVFAILMLSIVNPSFAANWQNPWTLEKVDVEKGCAEKYKHSSVAQEMSRNDYLDRPKKHSSH